MIFVENGGQTDARVNLAIEEHVLRSVDLGDDLLLFYINAPSIIIGRNQNTLAEINHRYVQEHGITVVRRVSGGGAVYHDLGNLNFSFITRFEQGNFNNFAKFTEPVIRVLRGMGVPAELSGRNDITVDGRKVSGNAQYRGRERMFSHGTLLFNSDLDVVSEALNVRMDKMVSKGIKSVRSRVANISEFIAEPMEMAEFRRRILEGLFAGQSSIPTYHLSAQDHAGVQKLVAERYGAWEWNYGKSPAFDLEKRHRFPCGEIQALIKASNGVIEGVRLYGDFFGQRDVSELEARLAGVRFEPASLRQALEGVDFVSYFGGLSLQEFVDFLF